MQRRVLGSQVMRGPALRSQHLLQQRAVERLEVVVVIGKHVVGKFMHQRLAYARIASKALQVVRAQPAAIV